MRAVLSAVRSFATIAALEPDKLRKGNERLVSRHSSMILTINGMQLRLALVPGYRSFEAFDSLCSKKDRYVDL